MKVRILLTAGLVCVAQSLQGQSFGGALAVAGGDVLIAAPGVYRTPGTVFVYRQAPTGRWAERATITASDGVPRDGFGAAMSADGDQVLIAAAKGPGGRGAAYLFRRARTGVWSEVGALPAVNVEERDGYGAAVALSGSRAAVAAPQSDSGRGAVYLFRREGEVWMADGRLTAAERAVGERFGASISLDGDRLLVGAPTRERNIGTAYVFARAGGAWRQEAVVAPVGLAAASNYGVSVLVRGDRVFVGASGVEMTAGAVFVMRRDSTGQWRDEVTLRAFDQARGARFGAALAMAGGELVVGASGADTRTGRVYRLRGDTSGRWADAASLRVDSAQRGDVLGATVAAGGGVTVAGMLGADNGAGRAAIFDRDRAGAVRSAVVWNDASPLTSLTGAQRRCEGNNASAFGCSNVDLLSFLPASAIGARRGVAINDVWGWVDPETRREYALVGRSDGTSFVDVTSPGNPIYLGDLPKTDSARAAIWRDIKVYHNYAFVVADGSGPHGMQVFDLTQLRTVRPGQPRTFTTAAHYTRINSAHNIVINEETGFAYAVGASSGGETCGGGLHMIDIRDPLRPAFAGCFADPQTGRSGTGYSHDAQCVTYRGPDVTYRGHEICLGSNETALSIADVTNKSAPVAVSRVSYPNVGYTHQGWLTEDHRYFYVDDELDELAGSVPGTRTLIFDVSDLDDPVLAGQYVARVRSIDHNLYIRGNTAFLSNYSSGLRVLDITNRTNPVEVGYFDTVPWGEDQIQFEGSWSNYPYFPSGNVVVTSIGEGVFVVRARPSQPVP